jgi:hypothetical protein
MTPDDPRPFVQSKTSQRVGVGSAVVASIRISHAARRVRGGGIRDRTGCGSADCAGSFVGNLTRRRHGNGIIDIAAAAGAEPRSTATLSGVISDASESAREAIVNGCADHLTWSSVCHHNRVGVLCAGSGSRLAIAHRDLEVGFEGNVVTIRRSVITRIGIGDSVRRLYARTVGNCAGSGRPKFTGRFVGN